MSVQMVPLKTLEVAALRMRDKQLSIRKEVITAFVTLFRSGDKSDTAAGHG